MNLVLQRSLGASMSFGVSFVWMTWGRVSSWIQERSTAEVAIGFWSCEGWVFMAAELERVEADVGASPRRPALSPREIEVLLQWIASDSKAEVATALHLSVGTVNTHLTRIRAKYADAGRAAPTKAALVARALQDSLIRLEDL